MSGYHRLITRKKAGEERSASADRFSRRGSASSRFPCAPPAGAQLWLGGRRVRETALAVFKNGWPKKVAFPVKSFADVREEHKHPTKSSSCFLLLSCLRQGDQCPSS